MVYTQGGVLSPILFSIYIDRLLLLLKKSGIGCHLNGTYCGALAYADDITISCPSRRGLNRLLYICHSFVGYEPAGLTVHPPPQNDREWVHFFRMGV